MPNRETHRPVGMALGGAYAAWCAQTEPGDRIAFEALGGVAGGWLGAALPDWIDPPVCPDHRHFGHGAANVIGAVWVSADAMLDIQQRLRRRADRLARQRPFLESDLARFLNWLEECMLRFLAGLLNGLVAGYLSHLFLDALTARGIPFFARGC